MNPTDLRPLGTRGLRVTQFGFGGAALGNLLRAVGDDDAAESLASALALGVKYFDTAPYYGHGLSEQRMGQALAGRPRDTFVLSSKVGRVLVPWRAGQTKPRADTGYVDTLPFDPEFDYSYDGVMRSYESSLKRLGVERIDVLLIHDIGRMTHGDQHAALFDVAMRGAYRALDELRAAGAVKAIGLGVNEIEVCLEAMEHGDFDCFLLAGRYTLLEQRALDQLLPRCERRNVSIILGGPYNSGLLAGRPQAGATWNYAPAPPEVLARAQRLHDVCNAHGVALAAAALQFPLFHPNVSSVIPGVRNASELRQNLAYMSERLPAVLWRDLKTQGLVRSDAPTGG
jgi:D-threo-aldose 1-dehydrogenase